MEDNNVFTCSICNRITTTTRDISLYSCECDQSTHNKAAKSAPLAGCFKCQVCNRIELKTRDGRYYGGCNIFETHKEFGIVGFHDVCFQMFASKWKSEHKSIN